MAEPSKFAIHEAARDGRLAVVESLLNANAKLADLKDEDGRLPIHWATSYGHYDIAVLLAASKTFDPDCQDASGWTPLMIAVSLKEADQLVDLFLLKEADVNAKNFNGQTPLHFASSKKNISVCRKLLAQKPPASARVKDKRGQYAIHRAAAVGSVPIVELLLKEGKSPLNAADVEGQTPLHHAVAEGHGDTAVALLKAGAETDKKDADGKLPLEVAPDSSVRKFIIRSAEREGIDL